MNSEIETRVARFKGVWMWYLFVDRNLEQQGMAYDYRDAIRKANFAKQDWIAEQDFQRRLDGELAFSDGDCFDEEN